MIILKMRWDPSCLKWHWEWFSQILKGGHGGTCDHLSSLPRVSSRLSGTGPPLRRLPQGTMHVLNTQGSVSTPPGEHWPEGRSCPEQVPGA